jgi:phosphate-selective porin OprO/OprP
MSAWMVESLRRWFVVIVSLGTLGGCASIRLPSYSVTAPSNTGVVAALGPPMSPEATKSAADIEAVTTDSLSSAPSISLSKPADKPTIELRGRIQADAIFVDQSARNRAILGEIQNATGFRRARLGAQGTVGEHVNWVAEFDFAGGNVSFKDMFIGLADLPIVRQIRVGNFREPFTLEGQTSSNVFTFTERSPAGALDPARKWGIGAFSYDDSERATLAGGVFRTGTSSSTGSDFGDANDLAYTFRATALPWYDETSGGRSLMHVGAAFSQVKPAKNLVTISQSPQNSLLTSSDNPSSFFIPAINIPAHQQQLYNLEWAWVRGPFSLQTEWDATYIHQIGGPPVFLHGCYAFASYFLTGEHREYVRRDGAFGITKVRAPFVCLKNRVASGNIPKVNGLLVGNRDAELTLGLNWYLNDYTRLQFNYLHAIVVDPNFGPSAADAFFLRSAIFW